MYVSGLPPSPFVFLSYARSDLAFALRLKKDLQKQDIAIWMDQEGIPAASPDWQETIRTAICSCCIVILVASPSASRSSYVRDELDVAKMYKRPVYPIWAAGVDWIESIPLGWGSVQHTDARESSYEITLPDIVSRLQVILRSDPAPSLTKPDLDFVPRNPYKGLAAFTGKDTRDFFGREKLVDDLADALKISLVAEQKGSPGGRMLAILGPSGSGKSSVMMAALLPELQAGRVLDSKEWVYLEPVVPSAHPLEALAISLARKLPDRSLNDLRDDLENDMGRGLHQLASLLVASPATKVVLPIDQFEELFMDMTNEKERQLFIDLLVTAVTEPRGPVIVLLTLRADFYDRPMHYPPLYRLMQAHNVSVLPMELDDLRTVIEKPAQLHDVQMTFEDHLVGDLLFEMREQAGALPLLEFALDQLFQHRDHHRLTVEAYKEIGGVKGALTQHLEATYHELPSDEHRSLARSLFLRLIDPGTVKEEATRRRIPRSELIVVDQEKTTRLTEVTNTFTQARLLTTNIIAGVPTVEVSHEALIPAWVRLQDWLNEARDDIRLQQVISKDTAEWNRYGQSVDRLYRGSQLKEALLWRKANLPSIDEDHFLQASIKQRQHVQRRTFLIGGLIGVAGITGTRFLITTLLERPIQPHTYNGHTDLVSSVAWSPDGNRVASGSWDHTVQVWDARSTSRLLTYKGHTDWANSIVWSSDGKRIASGSRDKTVQVWDANSGSRLLTYTGHSDAVFSVAWSPDDKYIVSGSADHTVQAWDASNGSHLRTYVGHIHFVNSVAWSPDGKRIASGANDKTVQVWDANSTSHLLTYTGHTDWVNSVAWSPDSRRIASGANDKTVQVWDASSGSRSLTYADHADIVESVAWSPDGKRIASGAADYTAQIWEASNGSLQFTYAGHSGIVESVAWSPDGNWLASGSGDTTMQVWASNNGSLQFAYNGHTGAVNSVAWSPDGKRITSGSDDKTVQVWDANSGLEFTYTGHSSLVYSVTWSPDGRHIASGSQDKTVRVWDTNSRSLLFTYAGHTNWVIGVAWSPNGEHVASASYDETVQIWKASSGSHLLTYRGHTSNVYSVAWSPDGKRIASGSQDKTVQVWDANSGSLLFTYRGHTGTVYSVAWSPDGKRIASASYDETIQIWDASSGSHLLTYRGHTSNVYSVAWSPDGKRIASGSADKTMQVWDASSGSHPLTYRGHTSLVYSVTWSPDGKHIASGSDDKTVRIWHVT